MRDLSNTPSIRFTPAQPLPKHELDSARFLEITSPFLRAKGACHYCWISPGEELVGATDGAAECVLCPNGGFLYLFSADTSESDPRDCFFEVMADQVSQPPRSDEFPDQLGPFSLVSTELRPVLDFTAMSHSLTGTHHSNANVRLLQQFGHSTVGKISPASRVSLPNEARRKLLIPLEATHFVWAYQGVDVEKLTSEQKSQLSDDAELSFTSLGGYVYLQAKSGSLADLQEGKVVGVNAISVSTQDVEKVPDLQRLEAEYAGGKPTQLKLQNETGAEMGEVKLNLQFEERWLLGDVLSSDHVRDELKLNMMKSVLDAKAGRHGVLKMTLVSGANVVGADDGGKSSDPYCRVRLLSEGADPDVLHEEQSDTTMQTLDPVWNHACQPMHINADSSALSITIWDWDKISGDDLLGTVYLPIEYLVRFRQETEIYHYVTSDKGNRHGRLRMKVLFVPNDDQALSPTSSSKSKKKPFFSCCARPQAAAVNTASTKRAWKKPVYIEPNHSDDFIDKVRKTVGEEYEVIGAGVGSGHELAVTLGEMRLVVLARRAVLPHIAGAQFSTEATGLGGVYTNKGGIAAKFDFRGTSICFICSHLAAHEGIKHCKKRNDDAKEIQLGARTGNSALDLGSQFDHVFWAGDLNYRQEDPAWWDDPKQYEAGAKSTTSHQDKLYQVKQAVATRNWAHLSQHDELKRELSAQTVFAGFNDALDFEQDIAHRGFLPTFKMERGNRYNFFSQRVPSFTDRVLWRSAPGSEACLALQRFTSAPSLITSDHKPVSACFALSVPCSVHQSIDDYRRAHWDETFTYAVLRLSELKVSRATDSDLPTSLSMKVLSVDPSNSLLQGETTIEFNSGVAQRGETVWTCSQQSVLVRTIAPSAKMLGWEIDGPGATRSDSPGVVRSEPEPELEPEGAPVLPALASDARPVFFSPSVALHVTSRENASNRPSKLTRAGSSRKIVTHGDVTKMVLDEIHEETSTSGGTDFGFGLLALRKAASNTASPETPPEYAGELDSESLEGGAASWHYYDSGRFEVPLSLNGVGHKGVITGRLELFDVAVKR